MAKNIHAGSLKSFMTRKLNKNPKVKVEVERMVQESLIHNDLILLREKAGLTQKQLAHKLGVSQPLVARIESGRVRNLTLKTLLNMVTTLGGSLEIKIKATRAWKRPASNSQARHPVAASAR